MNVLLYASARLARALATILGVLVGAFLLLRLAPGDPALLLAGEAGSDDAAFIARLRSQMGLDQPLLTQLGHYLSQVLHGDLGYSYHYQASVAGLIVERLPATLLLMGSAFVFSLLLGVSLGVLAAHSHQRRGWLDRLIGQLVWLLFATPSFWLALLLVLLFSLQLGWLPAFGLQSVGADLRGAAWLWDRFSHLVLPCLSLSFLSLAMYVHLTRSAVLDILPQEYVRLARAKGLPEARILRRHVLRNALLPVVTFAGLQLGQLASGAVLIEVVYAWPGIGRLLYESLDQRDYAVLLGVFLVISTLVVVFNLITDLLCRWVDPRIGAAEASA
ncbi:MAG: Glutathione transport system permease protein GsiC [Pseudomonas citronellolis]|nr:MAG: Glutathione transport system permease protein GsiC [Pseudomonas citronellolis]